MGRCPPGDPQVLAAADLCLAAVDGIALHVVSSGASLPSARVEAILDTLSQLLARPRA